MTDHARAVIVGGGVGGTSIAYHLAERGWTDIVLVDRAELTSGSTFHSAGLVGQLRSSVTLTRMMMYGVDLYRRLTAETGVDVGWREVGSLRLASSGARFEELQRQAGWARTFGLPLPRCIKVDVDGAEASVLEGAAETLRTPGLTSVLVEVDDRNSDVVTRLLQTAGLHPVARHERSEDGARQPFWYGIFER